MQIIGNDSIVESLIKCAPLHIAVKVIGNDSIVESLIKCGVNVNAVLMVRCFV